MLKLGRSRSSSGCLGSSLCQYPALHVVTARKNSLVVNVSLEGERVSLCLAEQGGWGEATELRTVSVCCSFGGPV